MLNENQARRVGIRLGRISADAARLAARIERGDDVGLSAGEAARLREALVEVAESARTAAAELGVPLRDRALDLATEVERWSIASRVSLLDCRSARLSSGGAVDAGIALRLDAWVGRIVSALEDVQSRAERGLP